MNKQTISQLEERRRKLLNRLVRTADELHDIDTKIRKIKNGKLRQPAPAGIKGKIASNAKVTAEEFGDLVPSFGNSAAIE